MKVRLVILVSVFTLLLSCADGDTVTTGKLECNLDILYVTSTEIVMNVTVPEEKSNLVDGSEYIQVILRDRENPAIYFWQGRTPNDNNVYQFHFDHLTANTTYDIELRVYANFPGFVRGQLYYYPNKTVTTSKEGEYHGIGDFNLTIAYYKYKDPFDRPCTVVRIIPPSDVSDFSLYYDGNNINAFASLSQDMENSIVCHWVEYEYENDVNGFKRKKSALIYFPVLEKKKYYFEFKVYSVKICNDSFDNDIWFSDIIAVQKSLDFSNLD